MMPNIPTRWTKAQVEALLAEEELLYQRIQLPYGLATPGRDRTPTAQQIFPESLRGKSVLDVGSYLGFFCFEALRRGADRVIGLEVDAESVRKARRIADCLGLNAEFVHRDVEHEAIDGRFDYVLCLNVLHHFRNPLAVLDKLARAAREKLVLETVAFESRERMKTGLSLLSGTFLSRQPVLYAAPTGPGQPHRTPKFVISRGALDTILTSHKNTFARLTHSRSDFRGRYITIADKRRIGRLVILAGPTSDQKAILIDRLRSGRAARLVQTLGVGSAAIEVVGARELQGIQQPVLDSIGYDYDFLIPYEHHHGQYERDEFLDVVETAEEVVVATLGLHRDERQADSGTLARDMKRPAGQRSEPRARSGKHGPDRVNATSAHYDRWFRFSTQLGRNVVVVPDDGNDYEILSVAEWTARLRAT